MSRISMKLSEWECLCETMRRSRSDPIYMKMLDAREELDKKMKWIFYEFPGDATVERFDKHLVLTQYHTLCYELGFFDGEMFNIVKQEMMNESKDN